jgi:hypothetical protein
MVQSVRRPNTPLRGNQWEGISTRDGAVLLAWGDEAPLEIQ